MKTLAINSPTLPQAKPAQIYVLPATICFRITRFCNARCGFCLAPPDGGIHPAAKVLKNRIDWLVNNGAKTIHFCGGEPTIHQQLPELIEYVIERGKKTKLTTNGIAMSDELMHTLLVAKTQVRVSLHGNQSHHNEVVGCDAYDKTTATIQRLISGRVSTAVQTTIISGHLDMVELMIQFCIENRVKRLSILPFIPRGSGYQERTQYELSSSERRDLQNLVTQQRRKLRSRIDIRLLDFNIQSIPVVEPDGQVLLESSTEARDILLYQLP
jgi:MoaA/NifB/PqqE/SkfB family radical SAM enzyme